MDGTILLFLLQDGITNGAIYALLGVALVLVFAVTKVIFLPQGEFVAFGALTYALFEAGRLPATIWLLVGFGALAFLFDAAALLGGRGVARGIALAALVDLAVPAGLALLAAALAGPGHGAFVHGAMTVALITPMGPLLYRVAFQPLASASVLTLLIAAVGVHLAMVSLGLVFFGAEGLRAPELLDMSVVLGPLSVTGQNLAVYGVAIVAITALWIFFERSLWGKALRATSINRLGARLVGIPTAFSGALAFALAALIGAISGILVAPMTTVYYDTGFLIGLKGFVAAIIGGLAAYPLTAVAALAVGIVEALASFFASDMKEVIVFTLIIPVLAWRSLGRSVVEDED